MISIFNGRNRSLSTSTNEVYTQVSVEMRQYLHLFNNGKNLNSLGVFLAIALHADGDGWAWPGRERLMNETGIATKDALADALTWLRGMHIDGHPVIKQYRILAKGKFYGSAFHIFPDSGGDPPVKLLRLGKLTEWKPSHDQPDTVLPCPDQPNPDDPDRLKENHLKEEPDHSAASGGVLIDLFEAIPNYQKLSNQQKQAVKVDCPACGEQGQIGTMDVRTPCCQMEIDWKNNLRAKKHHARIAQVKRIMAGPKATQEVRLPGCRYLIDQARKRKEEVLGQKPGTCKDNVNSKEAKELFIYESKYGEAFIRSITDALDGEHGRGLIVHVVNSLPHTASNLDKSNNGATQNGIKQPEPKPTLVLTTEAQRQLGLG